MVKNIIGRDHFMKGINLIGCPSRAAIPAIMTLAEAPIMVPFPPKHAPNERAHHAGIIISLPPRLSSMDLSMGIIVATNGMLSTMLEKIAETQIVSKVILGSS